MKTANFIFWALCHCFFLKQDRAFLTVSVYLNWAQWKKEKRTILLINKRLPRVFFFCQCYTRPHQRCCYIVIVNKSSDMLYLSYKDYLNPDRSRALWQNFGNIIPGWKIIKIPKPYSHHWGNVHVILRVFNCILPYPFKKQQKRKHWQWHVPRFATATALNLISNPDDFCCPTGLVICRTSRISLFDFVWFWMSKYWPRNDWCSIVVCLGPYQQEKN